jgi:NAD(P)-dependent dehydrogenase (short-subunit alcohol dehydrogenase family)
MELKQAVALVTGANRGLGLALTKTLLAVGANKVYAAARDPRSITLPGAVPLKLDVTDERAIQAAAEACGDVNLLINNAGVALVSGFLADGAIQAAREELEVNYFGPMRMTRAFAPILAANGGGTVVNILSVASWLSFPEIATYAASKAAAWSLTNGLRLELHERGTHVVAVHIGYMDTAMAAGIELPKISPDDVARQVIEAVATDREEVLADAMTRKVKQGLGAEPGIYMAS